jgi:hypothetical protein
MTKPKLLYVSINDGSDTRINKEIKTLGQHFDIYYLGIGRNTDQFFTKHYCKEILMTRGHHREKLTFLKFCGLFINTYFKHNFASIHVINEQLLLVFFPFMWWSRKKVVADIFDSMFLRTSNNWVMRLQKILYALPNKIIVTDENRKGLVMPQFQAKTMVVDNFPYKFKDIQPKASADNELLLLYSGALISTRGTALVKSLIEASPKVTVWLVGWLRDEATEVLSKHPQTKYFGVMSQDDSLRLSSQCDYILSLYEPIHENNLNASPNKIFDAVQVCTPVIINAEVKMSSLVLRQNLGYVIPSFYEKDATGLLNELIKHKKSFVFEESLQHNYTWEAVEGKLVEAHNH